MRKKKTSKKHGFCLKNMPDFELKISQGLKSISATTRLKNKKFIARALWQCLIDNDVNAFKEILRSHFEVLNKEQISKQAGIPRRTLFRMLSPEGNPTLENVSKIIHKLCA